MHYEITLAVFDDFVNKNPEEQEPSGASRRRGSDSRTVQSVP
jgi:hypothetical protein